MDTRTLCLEKEGHTYLFQYASGGEDAVIEAMMRLADDREVDFDWMDAATLTFQVAQESAEEACDAIRTDEPARE